ncbi:MAG: hypothetical protein WBE44_11070, partial [Terriglobales bacterium]
SSSSLTIESLTNIQQALPHSLTNIDIHYDVCPSPRHSWLNILFRLNTPADVISTINNFNWTRNAASPKVASRTID